MFNFMIHFFWLSIGLYNVSEVYFVRLVHKKNPMPLNRLIVCLISNSIPNTGKLLLYFITGKMATNNISLCTI